MQPDSSLIPPHVKETIDEWVRVARPTGDFVRAVLENNLCEAIGRADDRNLIALPHIVAYCYNHIPLAAWGSPARCEKWIDNKLTNGAAVSELSHQNSDPSHAEGGRARILGAVTEGDDPVVVLSFESGRVENADKPSDGELRIPCAPMSVEASVDQLRGVTVPAADPHELAMRVVRYVYDHQVIDSCAACECKISPCAIGWAEHVEIRELVRSLVEDSK